MDERVILTLNTKVKQPDFPVKCALMVLLRSPVQ